MTIQRIGKKPKAAPSVAASSVWPTGISKSAIATTIATPREISPARPARSRSPHSSTNSVSRGMAPHSALSASDPPTGSRSCWNMSTPEKGDGRAQDVLGRGRRDGGRAWGGRGGRARVGRGGQRRDRDPAQGGVEDLHGVRHRGRAGAVRGGPRLE